MDDTVEITVDLVHETDRAILIRGADDVEQWIPKSQVQSVDGDVGESVTIEIARWLAEERGLV